MRDLQSIRAAVGRIEATLPHLATQAQVAGIEAKLADKPGKLYLWGVLGVLGVLVAAIVTSYAAGLAALALLH